jgi:hypothetical protein
MKPEVFPTEFRKIHKKKIFSVAAEVLRADRQAGGWKDGQTDGETGRQISRHDEADRRFSQVCKRAKKRIQWVDFRTCYFWRRLC